MTSDPTNLAIKTEFKDNQQLMIRNGDGLNIAHLGMNSFTITEGNERKSLLKNILHVPHIAKSLLSVSQFTKENSVYLEFHPEYCCVKDKISGLLFLQGKVNNGLYAFNIPIDA